MVNAREQITQARANISSQRQMLEQRRGEVESSEKSAVEAREQMLSQRELRGRTIQDLPSARARKSEIERVQESAGKVRGRIVEAEQQLEEQEKQVSQYEKEAIAYETLNKEIARSGGITRGTSQGRIKEAFERAGLDPEEGTRIYMEQVGSSVGFGVDSQGTYAKKYADFIEYDELPTQQELTDMGARPGDVVTQTVSAGDTPGTLSLTYSRQVTPQETYEQWLKTRDTTPLADLPKEIPKIKLLGLDFRERASINLGDRTIKSERIEPQSRFLKTSTRVDNLFKAPERKDNFFETLRKIDITPEFRIPLMMGGSFSLRDLTEKGSEKLGGIISEKYEQIESETPRKEEIEEFWQKQSQARFEEEYMKPIIFGDIDFETASKQFEQSKTFKQISQAYSEDLSKASAEIPLTRKWSLGGQIIGLELGQKILDFTPRTYGELAVKSGLVYTGVKSLSLISPKVGLGLTGGFFVEGTYKALSPTSTPVQAGGGLITSVLTGVSLGYTGIKYLRSPVITTEPVYVKKSSLRTGTTIGQDIKILTRKEMLNKVLFGEQKLSQYTTAGRRTIVTTKGRNIAERFWTRQVGLRPEVARNVIYEGIPKASQKIYGADVFRGTRYSINLGKTDYQKALKKLTDYGYTTTQAKSTLRFRQPKVTEQWLKEGVLDIKGMSAKGRFVFETRKPVITVDDKLGIKTRGGRIERDVYNLRREILFSKDKPIMIESRGKLSLTVDKSGKVIKTKEIEYGLGLEKLRTFNVRKGFVPLIDKGGREVQIIKGETIWKPATYKDITSVSRDFFNFGIEPTKTKAIMKVVTMDKNIKLGRTVLFDKNIDLTKEFGRVKIMPKGGKIITDVKKTNILNVPKSDTTIKTLDVQSKSDTTIKTLDVKQTMTEKLPQLKSAPILEPIKTADTFASVDIVSRTTPIYQTSQLSSGTLATTGVISLIDTKSKTDTIFDIKSDTLLDGGSKTIIKQINITKDTTITDTTPLSLSKTATTQITIPQLKLKTENIQVPEVIKLSPQKTKTREIKTPTLKIPKIIPKLPLEKKRKLTAKEELGRLFEVFARAKGEDIKIGEELTLRGATRKLATELKGTLKASGFITEKRTGKKVRFTEVAGILGGEFEPAKKDIFRIVQKKTRRLGTGSEVFKIQRARKSGGFKWL